MKNEDLIMGFIGFYLSIIVLMIAGRAGEVSPVIGLLILIVIPGLLMVGSIAQRYEWERRERIK